MTDSVHRVSGPARFPPSQPVKAAPVFLLAGLGLMAGAIALVAGSAIESAALIAGGVCLGLISRLFRLAMTTVRDGYVRIDPHAAGLRFVPPRGFERTEDVAIAMMFVPGSLIATAFLTGLDRHAMSSPWSVPLVVASVVLPAYYLWTLRPPRGLTLTPAGVRGVRRVTQVDLTWDDMRGVTVVDGPGRGTLVIPGPDRRQLRVDAMRFGSDAHLVAAIISYFLDHERARELLTDGPRALERFTASL